MEHRQEVAEHHLRAVVALVALAAEEVTITPPVDSQEPSMMSTR